MSSLSSLLLVPRRVLSILLSLFLLCGTCATGIAGFGVLIPLVFGTPSQADHDDRVWKYVAAAFVPIFFGIKYKAFKRKLVDSEIARIKGLERPLFFLFYPPLKLLFLACMITSVKCLELYTPPSYYKDLVFASSSAGVSLLLGTSSVLVAKEAAYWREVDAPAAPLLEEHMRSESMKEVV